MATDINEGRPELQLAFLVDAVFTSPRRAAVRAVFQLGKGALHLVRDIRAAAQPRWTETPADVPSLVSWRDDQENVSIVIRADQVRSTGRGVLQRLYDDLPPPMADLESPDAPVVRQCHCWLEWDPSSGPQGDVTVNVGQFALTTLPNPHDKLVRDLIAHHGARAMPSKSSWR